VCSPDLEPTVGGLDLLDRPRSGSIEPEYLAPRPRPLRTGGRWQSCEPRERPIQDLGSPAALELAQCVDGPPDGADVLADGRPRVAGDDLGLAVPLPVDSDAGVSRGLGAGIWETVAAQRDVRRDGDVPGPEQAQRIEEVGLGAGLGDPVAARLPSVRGSAGPPGGPAQGIGFDAHDATPMANSAPWMASMAQRRSAGSSTLLTTPLLRSGSGDSCPKGKQRVCGAPGTIRTCDLRLR